MTDPYGRAVVLAANDLDRVGTSLTAALVPQRPYLTDTEYAIYERGKKIRPMLLVLAARLAGGFEPDAELPRRAIEAAVSLEMLHVATLIHDDIIDQAPKRRGLTSVNAARGTDVAILVGDMQFVQAVRCFAAAVEAPEDMALVQVVLDVGFKICCGELDELQTDPSWSPKRLRDRYFRTIDRKTAILFELACESGASLVRSRERAVMKLGRYGRLLGRAFQIMDDLSDFIEGEERAGKMRGTDLARRRPTLPIIFAMADLPADSAVHRIMHGAPFDGALHERAIAEVVGGPGFLRAYSEARRAVMDAAAALEYFPESPIRNVLVDLAYAVVNKGPGAVDAIGAPPLGAGDAPDAESRAASGS